MKKVFKIFASLLIALLMLLTAVGCELDEGEGDVTKGTAPTGESGSTATADNKETTATVGEFLSNDKWKITFQSAKQFDKIQGDSEFLVDEPAEGKVFLLLFFEVENISSADDYFNYLYFKNYIDGYSTDLKILLNDVDDCSVLAGDVAAGKKLKGYLSFEVSPDWKELETSYQEFTGSALKFKVTPDKLTK